MNKHSLVASGNGTARDFFDRNDADPINVPELPVGSDARQRHTADLRPAGLRARRTRQETRHRGRNPHGVARPGAKPCRSLDGERD
ncbi:hypothetical protein [Paraburkholderia sp. BL10I2N1]|uniref:hypothetical protein n=1 Tax=Paraburkholderia sp. BL10I2N1 TaxID=1938796 RepID=UPI00105D4A35|nr:hypothetical protein [Paraburkholderia sp. BL10I2N1]